MQKLFFLEKFLEILFLLMIHWSKNGVDDHHLQCNNVSIALLLDCVAEAAHTVRFCDTEQFGLSMTNSANILSRYLNGSFGMFTVECSTKPLRHRRGFLLYL